jgi:hypothetical protein
MKQAAAKTTSSRGDRTPRSLHLNKTLNPRQNFVAAALDMSWQLAIVVLVPILVGVQLDKKLGTSYVCTLVGLAIAFAGSGVVMWGAMQRANRLPVPKLTQKQKRAIRKSYEAEDDD